MDPERSSRLALDAAVVVAIDAVVVVIIASVRLLSVSFAIAASAVAVGVAAMVIARLRHVRESLAGSRTSSCDQVPQVTTRPLGHL